MPKLLTSRAFRAAAIVAALVGLYALLGFQAAPRLIRSQAIEFVRENYGRTLAIGEVRVNPFKFQVDIDDVAFPDIDGQTMLGFRRLFIDFEISSLWNRAYTFRAVRLDAPGLRAVVRQDGTVNLNELVPDESAPAAPTQNDRPLPSVWIKSLDVRDGAAAYLDQARRTPFERQFTPITFSLQDFRTTPEGGDFRLAARSQHDEQFEWKGRFALAPVIASQGDFVIGDLHAPGLLDFLGDVRPFTATAGRIDLAGRYEFALGEPMRFKATLPKIELTGLSLRARNADADWVQVPSLLISDTRVELPDQTVAIGNIALTGTHAQVWMSPDRSLNLSEMFAPVPDPATPDNALATPSAPAASATTAATAVPVAAASDSDWRVTVGSVEIREASVDFEDRALTPAVKFQLTPLNVGVRDVTLDLGKPLPVTFDATINGKASLSGAGQLTPEPLVAEIDLELAGFDLTDVQPYVGASTDMTVRRGTLGLQGKLGLAPADGDAPAATFAGDVAVTDFKSIDNALQQDFFNVARLELRKLRYSMQPDALSIDRIHLVRPFNRIVIASNQVLNVAAVFDPEGTAAAVRASEAAAAAKRPASSRKRTRAEVRAEKKAAAAAAKARAAVPPPAPELRETGMPIRIRELRIDDGRMDFADFSIEPNFAADIIDLNGTVTGLSSNPTSRARVDIKGHVGEFSPVTIAGEMQPFAFDRHTDLGFRFENISLPIFNPYSGKFAGYNIAKGKLTTDLHYTIADRKLDAKHHIRIDQLEWGEATAEKTEATLPVKFATSLLKDVDGVINLDVPVKGTLDDPKFRIGPIVWQIIKNILTKAVTAPFRALGALFKDAEAAQFVDFAPGEAVLDPATTQRLAGLAKALAPKADIRLNVPIGIQAELDVAALTEQRYTAALQATMTNVMRSRKAASEEALPAFDTLEPDRQLEVLTALVQQVTGAPPKWPTPAEPPEGTSRKEARALAQSASIEFLAAAARAKLAPDASALDQLGQRRAEAIEAALLSSTGLAPQRVFLVKNGKVAAQDGKVRLELAME